jgi:Ulp1 family protease
MPHHSTAATRKHNSYGSEVLSHLEDVISPDISLSLRNVKMTEEDVTHLSEVFSQEPDTILIDKFHIDMTVAKISCLEQGTWLNDEVINFYVSMLMEDLKQSTRGREIYIFSTFFMAKLNQGGQYSFHLVSRWTKNIDIFGLKKVFIPINIANNHWTLVFIDLTVKTIGYYDAMAGNGSLFMNLTLKVLPSPWLAFVVLFISINYYFILVVVRRRSIGKTENLQPCRVEVG